MISQDTSPTPVPKPVAFDIQVNDVTNPAVSEKVSAHFEQVESELETRRSSLSKDEILTKLKAAEARRQEIVDSRLVFAKEQAERIKRVQERDDQISQEAIEKGKKLEEKIESAAQRAEEQIRERQQRLEEQNREVLLRKQEAFNECLSPGREDVEGKLEAARLRRLQLEEERVEKLRDLTDGRLELAAKRRSEIQANNVSIEPTGDFGIEAAESRRKLLEQERLAKLRDHAAKVETVRKRVEDNQYAPLEPLSEKLEAAEARRRQYEQEKITKLKEKLGHVDDVRRRKAEGAVSSEE